ncbi:MAG: hypothetical protein HFJ54_04060 [Clostridia bacterium]|nr:hypothetical protein [Clostridia bacterium]
MNQILYTGKNSGPASIKSIVRFFAISIIVLGVIFIGEGSYALYEYDKLNREVIDNTVPEIAFDRNENNAVINITHNKGISRISYHWNDELDTIVRGNDQSTVVLDNISISAGRNTLHVTATDINGKSSESSYEYAYDGICIDLSVIDSTYLKITTSDVTGLSDITFKWNNSDEIRAYAKTEDPTVIEQMTEIPTGLNTLSITAVNSSGKTLTKTQDVKGIHPPVIQLFIQDNNLIVDVTDEEGIAKITQQINVEEEKVINLNGEKHHRYTYPINTEEDILVTITAVDIEGVSRTFKGKNY